MIFWNIALGFLLGLGIMYIALRFVWHERERNKENLIGKDKININLQDIISLAVLNTAVDVGALIIEYKIHVKFPEFYEKYQALNKQEKELYFNELIEILSKNRREYVHGLFDKYPGFTNQDVLLLLMCEMQTDNRTMARIMGLTLETLKKRKTRLRSKMQGGAADA